jgi:hypothetical protein
MDEDGLSALVLAHFAEALRLAMGALDLLGVSQDRTLHQLQDLETARQSLEVSTTALLQASGVSWEAMATDLGVTRQSLHRRLSRKSLAFTASPRSTSVLEQDCVRLIALLSERIEGLASITPRSGARGVARNLAAGHDPSTTTNSD